MKVNIPTWVTVFRIVLIPFFFLAFYAPLNKKSLICVIIFVIAAITDWIDGFLARRWKQTTPFGAFLDPVVDKTMVVMALIMVVEHFHIYFITLPASIMILREIAISALREWMAECGKRSSVSVCLIGKIKTTAQMISLVALLWHPNTFIEWIGITTLYIAVIFTFWSMFLYIHAVRNDFFKN